MAPWVSIITVTLNPGELLQSTVKSVLAQTVCDYEHIIKDGGSTDGSLAFLSELQYGTEGRYQLHVTKDDGIYEAMNQALRMAKGDYVYFLNAGDSFHDAKALNSVFAALPAEVRPEVIYTDYLTGPGNQYIRNPRRLSSFFLYRTTLNHQCCLFRREVMQAEGGFDCRYRVLADFEFLVRLMKKGDVIACYLPLRLAHYREGGFSESEALEETRRTELRQVRRTHFSPGQRFIFACLWGMTFPGLRRIFLKNRGISGLYTGLRNMCYKA